MGSHWVSLVIRCVDNNQLEALYADSLGETYSESIKSSLTKNGIENVKDCSLKQQFNAHDCGPWVVFNLDSLAKKGQSPIGIDEDALCDQRKNLTVLLMNLNNETMVNTSSAFQNIYPENSSNNYYL